MCSGLDDPTHPDNQDEIRDALAEVERWLANDGTTCVCNAQLQPHDWRRNVCPVRP